VSKNEFIPLPMEVVTVTHYQQAAGSDPSPRRIHDGEEYVELLTGGRGWVRDGGEFREVRPGSLLWHCCGDETISRSDAKNPYRCLAVRFKVRRRSGRKVPHISVWPEVDAVVRFTEEANRTFFDPDFDRDVLMRYLHATLLFQVSRHERRRRTQQFPEVVRIVLECMEKRFAEPLRLADLAVGAGCSLPHLHDLFRRHVAISPHQWLIQRRLRAAQEKLLGTRASIKEIAHECGFHDPAAFVNAFKRRFGITPAAFRAASIAGQP